MALSNPVLLAQIGAPHGIKGEVRVKTFTGDPHAIGDYGPLHTSDGRKFKITRMHPSKTVMVVKFKGVNFRDEAEALKGLELFVDRASLPDDVDEDEYYVTDMIGCDAVNEHGERLGHISDVQDFGAGDVLEVTSETAKPFMIAFTKANVPQVDLEARQVTLSLPEEVASGEQDNDPTE